MAHARNVGPMFPRRCCRSAPAGGSARGRRNRRRDSHAELVLELLDQLGQLDYRQAADRLENVVDTHTGLRRHRSEEHTSELQSHLNLVCRLLLEKKKKENKMKQ